MDVSEVRARNLRLLVQRAGGPTAFGLLVGRDQVQVSQWTSEKTQKVVGTRLARDIERQLELERGWLDRPQWTGADARPALDPRMLVDAYVIMDDAERDAGRRFSLRNVDDAARFVLLYTWRSHMRRDPSPAEWIELGRKMSAMAGALDGRSDTRETAGHDASAVAGTLRTPPQIGTDTDGK